MLALLLTMQGPLFAIDNMEIAIDEPLQAVDDRSTNDYTCENYYSTSEEKVVKTIHNVLDTYWTQLDTMSADETVQSIMKEEREKVVNMTESALNDRDCYWFDEIMWETKNYATMIPASKKISQEMLWEPNETAKKAMLVLQSHLLSQYDDYKALEQAISNTVDINMNLNVAIKDEFLLDTTWVLSMQNIINTPDLSLQSMMNIKANGVVTYTDYIRNNDTYVPTTQTNTFDGALKWEIIVQEDTMYIKPIQFALWTNDEEVQKGEQMVQRLIEKLNWSYIKLWNEELNDIDQEFSQIAQLSLWKQLQVYKTLKEQSIFDYYHTEGNTSYWVIGEWLCEIVWIINWESERYDAKEDCLETRIKMLLSTDWKWLFTLTNNDGQITWGVSDMFANSALKDDMNSDEFSSINLNTTILWRNNDRINTVSIMLPSASEEISTNKISYAYPNLSILYNEQNEGVSLKIDWPITQDNIDLKGSLTVINDRSDEKVQWDMSLSMKKQNNTYNGSLSINGKVSNTATKEELWALSLELTNTKTVSTTNVPSITIPQNTISLEELEIMTDEVDEEFDM